MHSKPPNSPWSIWLETPLYAEKMERTRGMAGRETRGREKEAKGERTKRTMNLLNQ